jgi:hypothetical protein
MKIVKSESFQEESLWGDFPLAESKFRKGR